MFIKETVIFEAYCDKCGNGMLQDFLNTGYMFKMKTSEFIGNEIKCTGCGHKNKIEDAILMIPGEFNVWSQNDITNYKKETGISKFLND